MRRLITYLRLFDLFVVLCALVFSNGFVSISGKLLDMLGLWTATSIGFAYALVICGVCFLASFMRKYLWKIDATSCRNIWIDVLILVAAGLMFFQVFGAPGVTVDMVTSPYISYAVAVFFFMGVGYAMADLSFYLTRSK